MIATQNKAFSGFSKAFVALALILVIAACSAPNTSKKPVNARPHNTDIVANSYQAVERLLNASQQAIDKSAPILVASLVNVASLQRSSNFGRMVSEQVASRLSQLGYDTREIKLRSSFLMREGEGQFVLSRQVRDLSLAQEAQAVITGVYAVARDDIYLTLRLVRAADAKVISSVDYRLPMDANIAALLAPYDVVAY